MTIKDNTDRAIIRYLFKNKIPILCFFSGKIILLFYNMPNPVKLSKAYLKFNIMILDYISFMFYSLIQNDYFTYSISWK